MCVRVVTPPEPIVDLDTVKAHLRYDDDDADDYIEGLLAAATDWIDGPGGWTGRAIGPQTLELSRYSFFDGCRVPWHIELPYPPLIDIVSVTYADSLGVDTVLSTGSYRTVDIGPGAWALAPIYGGAWPTVRRDYDAVRIRYRAGYVADPEADPLVPAIPPAITHAVLLLIGHWFANRESTSPDDLKDIPAGVDALLAPHRILRV